MSGVRFPPGPPVFEVQNSMEKIKRTREVPVKKKIVSHQGKKKLVSEINKLIGNDPEYPPSFKIKFEDNSSHESSNYTAIFQNNIPKRVIEIEIYYSNFKTGNKIDVSLKTGNYGNRILVSGYDDTWTDGTTKRIEEI